MHVALLSALALLAPAAVGPPVTLACALPMAGAAHPSERIFKIGSGSLQEWSADKQTFGINLCSVFACSKTPGRTEGTVSSASVSYTVGVEKGAGKGYWRAAGASGLRVNHGDCRVVPAPAPHKP